MYKRQEHEDEKTALEAKLAVAQQHSSGIGNVAKQGEIAFPASYAPPAGSVVTAIKECGLSGVSEPEFIAEQSSSIAQARITSLPPGIPKLSLDEATAIAAYSFDLRGSCMSNDPTGEGKDNLYIQVNKALRNRAQNGGPLAKLRPYLYFLFQAWRALPALSGTVV